MPFSTNLHPPDDDLPSLRPLLRSVYTFSRYAGGITLRNYQRQVAEMIVQSVRRSLGLTFVVVFPRQSGKNELQAQIEAYLLFLYATTGAPAEMVKISPTWKPQTQNAIHRLERVLGRNLLTRGRWEKQKGYILQLGGARLTFLSGSPEANIVGATANLLLEVDEAQDIAIAKFDKDIAPMAASSNATRVFWGTAWTGQTLLARESRAASQAQAADGLRRVFWEDADSVGREVPAYRAFVAEQVRRFGREHPLVRTQYFSQEIAAGGGLFTPQRLELLRGDHPYQFSPQPGACYAMLIDVGGEDANADQLSLPLFNPWRDFTALTIVEVDLSALDSSGMHPPVYRVVHRLQWQGERHATLLGALQALIESWRPRYVVIDATGLGMGLASLLSRAFPQLVLPFVFTPASKSRLGYGFLALIDAGRWREYDPAADAKPALPGGAVRIPSHEGAITEAAALQRRFFAQLQACEYEVKEGASRTLVWGVPPSRRDAVDGAPLHDDLLISAALAVELDNQPWSDGKPARLVRAMDALLQLDREGF